MSRIVKMQAPNPDVCSIAIEAHSIVRDPDGTFPVPLAAVGALEARGFTFADDRAPLPPSDTIAPVLNTEPETPAVAPLSASSRVEELVTAGFSREDAEELAALEQADPASEK